MPSFIARGPIYLLSDGTLSDEPAEGSRRLAGRGHTVTEAQQRRYGIANPDLAPPKEDESGESAAAPPTERPTPKRSRR